MMNAKLQQLVQGQLKATQLPQQIDLADLTASLSVLAGNAGRDQVEWGGCVTMETEGLHMPPSHQVKGEPKAVAPECEPTDPAHRWYVGFAHIHLPDDATGKPYLGFSDLDFRGTLVDGDCLALVCNGPEVFALVRTADCTQARCEPDDSEFAEWEWLYDDLIAQALKDMGDDPASRGRGSDLLNRALWQANRELCRRLGYAFYSGKLGQPLRLVYRPLPGGSNK